MTHIDLDEFIFVNNVHGGSEKEKPLLGLANKIFSNFPEAPAFYMNPVMMQNCEGRHKSAQDQADGATAAAAALTSPLPRLGKMNHGRRATKYEHKTFMRTEAISMFFIHYLATFNTSRNADFAESNIFYPHRKHVTMLHYKEWETQQRHTVLGKLLPHEEDRAQDLACRDSVYTNVLGDELSAAEAKAAEIDQFKHHRVGSLDQRRRFFDSYRTAIKKVKDSVSGSIQ
jgi:hypothetical protein